MNLNRTARFSLVVAAGALALAACGSNSSSDTSTSGGSSASTACATGSIKASGSSAQKNAMTDWVNAFQQACAGATINYQANGSGAGIQDFTNAQTAFAGSDSPLKDTEQAAADKRCATCTALNIPMVGSAISVAYNLAGVDKLILNPAVIAGIFDNKITKWNDPKIAALNAGVALPDATIAQFHRSDASGTTANFTAWLTDTEPAWTAGNGKEWKAMGGQGSKGTDGVVSSLKSTPNSIGYVDLAALDGVNDIKSAWVDNGAGAVEATPDNAAITIAGATVTGTGNNLSLKLDHKIQTPNAYPIVLVTYEITCDKGLPAADSALVKAFLTYTAGTEGQGGLAATGYVPITGDLLAKVQTAVASIA